MTGAGFFGVLSGLRPHGKANGGESRYLRQNEADKNLTEAGDAIGLKLDPGGCILPK
jgi:hypothetical protein